MKKISLVGCGAVFCAVVLLIVASGASGAIKSLPIGAAAPDFTLKGVDGQDHVLSQLKGSIVVIDFCSIECPYSKGVDLDLMNLPAQYAGKGVVVLGINSNFKQSPEQIQKYVAEKKIPFPIVKDADNKYADLIGATRTPEFYVLDKDLKIAYHGAYDNRKMPDKAGDTNYVKNAIDDLLAGRAVKTAEMDAWGCSIKRVSK